MSEIDKPGQPPQDSTPPAEAGTSGDWQRHGDTGPAGSLAEEPVPLAGDTRWASPAQATPALPPAAPPGLPDATAGQVAAPAADPAGQPSGGSTGYAAGSYAVSGQPGGGHAGYEVGSYAASGQPGGGHAGYGAGSYAASGEPGGGYAAGSYPPGGPPGGGATGAWAPPAANAPKRVPAAVKWVAGGAAAVMLALCSGITGAVVATAIADKDGFSLPISTNAAPVVDRSSLAGVAAKVQPSVVSISTGSGDGSGVILTADGYILTNNHVVESARGGQVTVTLSDGRKVKAKIVGTDPKTDLAVIKAEATGLTPATLGDSNRVAVGDTVLAIGSPLGLQGSVTSGIISARDRIIGVGQNRSGSLSGLLQTDAPINPGNSGGALVNMNGDVIGINTAIATSGSGEGNIGVGFAIPSNKAKQVAEQLIKGEKVSHPFLGVSVQPEETGGAKIGQITAGSPAEAAGLQVGDVITKFGDRIINDSNDLVSAVQSGTVGQKVTVEYNRNGEKKTATVTLGEAS